jgi:hypothetical protein
MGKKINFWRSIFQKIIEFVRYKFQKFHNNMKFCEILDTQTRLVLVVDLNI